MPRNDFAKIKVTCDLKKRDCAYYLNGLCLARPGICGYQCLKIGTEPKEDKLLNPEEHK